VIELLAREIGQRAHERQVAGMANDERQRVRRRLHLAVRVIDEHAVEIAHRLERPRGVGLGAQTEHRTRDSTAAAGVQTRRL